MSDVTPASTNLLYHGDINFKNPTPVIELYPRAYGQQDEFVPANPNDKGNGRKPTFMGSFLKYLAITGGVLFAGRVGLFGKTVKGWLGGGVKTLKLAELNSRIETKMAEYLDDVEARFAQAAGRAKDALTSAKMVTAADGSTVLRAEYQSGKFKEYTVKQGENVVKLIGEGPEEMNKTFRNLLGKKVGKEDLNIEEYILFDKADGAVKFRTELARKTDGKVRAYYSYKGEDVLNAGFNENTNKFKDYVAAPVRKRFWLFGPKVEKSEVRLFNDPVTGNPSVIKTKQIYNMDGDKKRFKKVVQDRGTVIRTFFYDKKGNFLEAIDASKTY